MDFLEKVATLDPVPAGGAAAAYTATLAMALAYKVVLFESNRKEPAPVVQATLPVIQKEIERLYQDLRRLVEEDAECYADFSKETWSGDGKKNNQAFLNIMTCSGWVMEKAVAGLERIRQLSRISSSKLKPHLRVAVELLSASIAGTMCVARENISQIRSAEKRKSYQRQLEILYDQALEKRDEVLAGL
ncbi:MAG: cyclodeaminase/cyclohydrolase family protein [Pseudomonadota bacterium]